MEFGGGCFLEVANLLQIWGFQSVTRALSALGSVVRFSECPLLGVSAHDQGGSTIDNRDVCLHLYYLWLYCMIRCWTLKCILIHSSYNHIVCREVSMSYICIFKQLWSIDH